MRTTETDKLEQALSNELPTLRLLYSGGAGVLGRVYAVCTKEMLIGRDVSDGEGICLATDERASRQHARIEARPPSADAPERRTIQIVDLESKNGTFVNGVRITAVNLSDGDIVRTGNSFLMMRYEQARRVDADAEPIFGVSPSMRELRSRLVQVAREPQTVLLYGETGVGKEVAAQALHNASNRSGPLVAVNCAAIPGELAESQLFGHVAGAFSGSRSAYSGFFRAAEKGTLFLDEVGELTLPLQAKLLRAIEERVVVPVGATRPIQLDVRLVAATNRDLRASVCDGMFRADLYARLCGAVLSLPPLRNRREDILPLLSRLLPCDPVPRLSARLVEALLLHNWPFNVRELVQMAGALKIHLPERSILDLPLIAERLEFSQTAATGRIPLNQSTSESGTSDNLLTSHALKRLYQENDGNISHLSRLVGRSRRQVRRLLNRYGITRPGHSESR